MHVNTILYDKIHYLYQPTLYLSIQKKISSIRISQQINEHIYGILKIPLFNSISVQDYHTVKHQLMYMQEFQFEYSRNLISTFYIFTVFKKEIIHICIHKLVITEFSICCNNDMVCKKTNLVLHDDTTLLLLQYFFRGNFKSGNSPLKKQNVFYNRMQF